MAEQEGRIKIYKPLEPHTEPWVEGKPYSFGRPLEYDFVNVTDYDKLEINEGEYKSLAGK